MADDPITRHFFSGFIRLHILHHAAEGPIYGAEIAEELVRHGYKVSQGILYPILHSLETLGYLSRKDKLVGGRIRKYYRATAAGRRVLEQAKDKLRELVAEVLEGRDRPFQDLREKRQLASGGTVDQRVGRRTRKGS
jgi:PadR family transcriptional regulator, regulatory protein PadR